MRLSNVLIIDSDPISSFITKRVIHQYNPLISISECSSGRHALEIVHNNPSQLIFADLYFKEMDVSDFIKEYHKSTTSGKIYLLCLPLSIRELEKLKGLDYKEIIDKPFNKHKLDRILADNCFTV